MPPPRGRTALLIVLAGLVLAASVSALLAIWRYTSSPTAPVAAERPPIELETGDVRRLGALLAVMLLATVAILAFIVGAYLVMRVGKSLMARNVGGSPTTYVDAWTQYRLSEERIAELTTDEPPPGDDSGRADGPDDKDDTPRRDA